MTIIIETSYAKRRMNCKETWFQHYLKQKEPPYYHYIESGEHISMNYSRVHEDKQEFDFLKAQE